MSPDTSLRLRWCVIAVTAAAGAACAVACIVADPPPDIPAPPPQRPTIVHGSVVPPTTQILSTFPPSFVVPIELQDSTQPFAWNVFYDYDPASNTLPHIGGVVVPDTTQVDGGVRIVEFQTDPPSSSSCHVIELIVALSFSFESPHTPDQYGGDSVVWFYNPSGDPAGCPVYDAGGVDGAFPADAADGGTLIVPDDGGGAE